MGTITFPDASDASTSSTNSYVIQHEIDVIEIAIKEAISSGLFYTKVDNTVMTSISSNIQPTVSITGNGTGATASVTVGSINDISIYNQIGNLCEIPNVIIDGDGSGATAHCNVTFSIKNIKLLNAVLFNDKNIILSLEGSDGTGTDLIPVWNTANYLIGINVSSTTGTGYDASKTYIKCLDSNGNNIPLSYVMNFCNGIVSDIVIDNSGYNYTWANVNFIVQGKYNYNGILATANINDGVSNITLLNPGSGYSAVPTVTITGGLGSGASATATINNGMVTELNLTNSGSGYSTNISSINGQTYFNAWNGNLVDVNLMRTLNAQMEAVIKNFQYYGYNIMRIDGKNNCFYWLINW